MNKNISVTGNRDDRFAHLLTSMIYQNVHFNHLLVLRFPDVVFITETGNP